MPATPEEQLVHLGLVLPPPLPAFGEYVPAVLSGGFLHVGGHFGTKADGSAHTGKVGRRVTVDVAKEAARSAAINLLSTVRAALGTLDDVEQVIRVYGAVNADPDFAEHTRVIDAASAVLVSVFGDAGRHARLAVGVSSLPADIVLELEATIRVVDR